MPNEITIPLLMLLIASGFMILVGILIGSAVKKERKIHENGIEVDSVVVRNESRLRDGSRRYTSFVKFMGDDGTEHECSLNYSGHMPIGRKVRIKYLPGKYDYVVFVSQEL